MVSHDSNGLCLECGLCCNGVIFANVRLGPNDTLAPLQSIGVTFNAARAKALAADRQRQESTVESAMRNLKLSQPCPALDGCRCRVYADRPDYCRRFECLLLKRVRAGRLDRDAALRLIRKARRRVEQVKRLLRRMGDVGEKHPLRLRFRRVERRLPLGVPDKETAGVFSRLTLAVHDLNMLLAESFYPEPQSVPDNG
jgi:Fe-S-cluster containining protein